MDLKILITGGSGRIGQRLVLEATQRGAQVVALCRPGADTQQIEAAGAEVILGDTTVPRIVKGAIKGCDAVIHAAGVRAAARDSTYQYFNIQGAMGLVEAACEAKIQACVFVSTLAAQGPSKKDAPHVSFANEKPIDAFGRSMLAAEKVFTASPIHERTYIMRPGLVCGTGGAFAQRLVQMVRRGLAPSLAPSPFLSLVHVTDVAEAALNAVQRLPSGVQQVYVSNDEPVTLNALVDEIERQLAAQPAIRLPVSRAFLSAFAGTANRLTGSTGLFAETSMTLNHLAQGHWQCSNQNPCDTFEGIQWTTNREIIRDAIARANV